MFEHKFEHSKVTMQCLLVGSFFAIYGSKSNLTTSGGNDLGWDFHSFSKQFCSNPNISIVYKKTKEFVEWKKENLGCQSRHNEYNLLFQATEKDKLDHRVRNTSVSLCSLSFLLSAASELNNLLEKRKHKRKSKLCQY